jgi:hypothetical protein
MRILILTLISAALIGADAHPLVPNGTGGWMPVQAGQTIYCPLTSGAYSAIPAAGTPISGQVYWATDTQTLYRCNGSAWVALTTSSAPSGAAGGDLGSTYPNPTVQGLKGLALPGVVTGAFLKLNGSGAWEFVSYGTGADQPAAGNDSRFTDARTPSGAAGGDLAGSYPNPTVGGILGLSLPGIVANSFPKLNGSGAWEFVTYGTGADTPVAGNDARLSNSRAPNGSASGDLSGTYPGPVVAGWSGAPLASTTPTTGHLMVANGTQWASVPVSGDLTLASSGAGTLASVGTAGTYTQVTTDAKGRVTAGATPSTLSGYGITDGMHNYGNAPGLLSGLFSARPSASIAGRIYVSTDTGALYLDSGSAWSLLLPSLSGDLTTSGTTATLAASGVGAGTFGSATQVAQLTVDAKGRLTAAGNVAITASATTLSGIVPLANGGTGANLSGTGGTGQLLKQTSSGGTVSVASLLNSDLPTSGVTAGTYKSATVNAQGIVTAGTNPTTLGGFGITDAVQNGGGAPVMLTGLDGSRPSASIVGRIYFASDTGKIWYDNGSAWLLELPALTGDLTTSGTTATLGASGVSSGTYGSAIAVPTVTYDAKGRATSATQTTIAIPASQVTSGTLAVARGGTGQSSYTDGQLLVGQTSSGSLVATTLTAGSGISVTNGSGTVTVASSPGNQVANSVFAGPSSGSATTPTFRALLAADVPGLPASQITSGTLSAQYGGTGLNGSSAANGSLPIGNGSGYSLATLTAGSGITVTNAAGAITIAASGSGSGTVTSVSQTVPSFLSVAGSPITTSGTLALTLSGSALPVSSGGTGIVTDTPYALMAGGTTSTGAFQQVSGLGTSGQILTSNGSGALPSWQAAPSGSGTVTSVAASVPSFLSVAGSPITTSGTLAISLSGTALPVANGGTGLTTSTAYGTIVAGTTGTGAWQNAGTGTTGQVLTSNGASALPTWQTVSGTGTVTSVAATVPAFLSVSGSPITTSGTLAVSLSGSALPVANGGSGQTSLTAYSLLAGGTTSTGAVQSISGLGTSGQVLTSNGASALPTWQTGGGGGVSSLNSLTGGLTIVAGSNITVTPSGTNITIASSGGGSGNVLQFSPCNLDLSSASSAGTGTTGRAFIPSQLGVIKGIRFYWSGPAETVDCSLWNSVATKVASIAVSATSTPGVFSGTFSSAYTLLASDVGSQMIISISDSSGTYLQGAVTSAVPSGSFSPPGVLFSASFLATTVDAFPTIPVSINEYIIEPTYQ